MRPRRLAAENRMSSTGALRRQRRFNEAAATRRGKLADRDLLVGARVASMRPRRLAAENGRHGEGNGRGGDASMRPRRLAAENADRLPGPQGHLLRFNEAAATRRGKPLGVLAPACVLEASMRPRRLAAENQAM